MEPVEPSGPKAALQAAREPLSLRFLLAFSASTVLTAAVAVPMAFQAHLARQERDATAVERPELSVLGTTTLPSPADAPSSDGLLARPIDGEPVALDGATLSGTFDLLIDLPGVVRVDWSLDDGDVVTDSTEPWTFDPTDHPGSEGMPVAAGDHVLTATVRFADGRVELRRATFSIAD